MIETWVPKHQQVSQLEAQPDLSSQEATIIVKTKEEATWSQSGGSRLFAPGGFQQQG